MRIPWVGWYDRAGQSHFSSWHGDTRDILMIGPKEPHGELPDHTKLYEFPPGADEATKKEIVFKSGGIRVIVFDHREPFGPVWKAR